MGLSNHKSVSMNRMLIMWTSKRGETLHDGPTPISPLQKKPRFRRRTWLPLQTTGYIIRTLMLEIANVCSHSTASRGRSVLILVPGSEAVHGGLDTCRTPLSRLITLGEGSRSSLFLMNHHYLDQGSKNLTRFLISAGSCYCLTW